MAVIGLNLPGPPYELPVVGILRLRVRTTVLGCAAAAAATLGWAAPAAADVTVTPAQAVQGDAGKLTFRVANDSPTASLTSVQVQFPAANPIAEVYPLSVPKWAPKIDSRPLDRSLPGLHGSRVTDTTSAITWTSAPGGAIKPRGVVDLPVALGPLPRTGQLTFTVVQTYSDGTVSQSTGKPAAAPPAGAPVTSQVTVTLLPATSNGAAAPAAPGGHGHGAAPRAGGTVPAAGTGPVAAAAPGTPGVNWWSVGGWICAALAGGYAVFAVRRGRRHPDTADEHSPAEREPVAAGGIPSPAATAPSTAAKTGSTTGTAGSTTVKTGSTTAKTGSASAKVQSAKTGPVPADGRSTPAQAGTSTGARNRARAGTSAGDPQPQPASASRWTYRDRR